MTACKAHIIDSKYNSLFSMNGTQEKAYRKMGACLLTRPHFGYNEESGCILRMCENRIGEGDLLYKMFDAEIIFANIEIVFV